VGEEPGSRRAFFCCEGFPEQVALLCAVRPRSQCTLTGKRSLAACDTKRDQSQPADVQVNPKRK